MMPQLQTIIERLKTDRGQQDGQGRTVLFAVNITDVDRGKVICTKKTASEMEDEAGSVEGFFNDMFNNGVHNIVIQPRKKNGTSFVDAGEPVKVNMKPKEEVHQAKIDFPPTHNPSPQQPLMGLMAGLNAMDVAYRFQDYPKVVSENERLKLENERLKEKIEEQKERILEDKYSADKSSGNAEMWTGLLANAPAVLEALGKLKVGGAASGLASPAAPYENLSAKKQQLIQLITGNPDDFCNYALVIMQGMLSSEAFGNDLIELVNKHKLITI